MDDFKIIARLLAAIHASEEESAFNVALVNEKVLHTTAKKRDNLALKLQKAGYIEGLCVVDDVDGLPAPVIMWGRSTPSITLTGLEYMSENAPLKKAMKEIRDTSIELASKTIANTITNFQP